MEDKVQENYDELYKIVLIGDSGVGKTCILSRYVKNNFPKNKPPTIGVEFATKTIKLSSGLVVKAQIWDTAGQERYKAITTAHYRRAVGALVVYDVTKASTFASVQKWIHDVKQQADPDIVIMLVGNKLDLIEPDGDRRAVGHQQGLEFAKENRLLFTETSALTSTGIQDAFKLLLDDIQKERTKLGSEDAVTKKNAFQRLGVSEQKESSGCAC